MRLGMLFTLLLQIALIGYSGNLLMTGGTEAPGGHFALIATNLLFGGLNLWNLTRA